MTNQERYLGEWITALKVAVRGQSARAVSSILEILHSGTAGFLLSRFNIDTLREIEAFIGNLRCMYWSARWVEAAEAVDRIERYIKARGNDDAEAIR